MVVRDDNTDDDLRNPFTAQLPLLSDSDLRETAYELLAACCRTTGGKSLAYISQSRRTMSSPALERSLSMPPQQRSPAPPSSSKVKKALGLKKKSPSSSPLRKGRDLSGQDGAGAGAGKAKRPGTVGELMRVQMGISEHADSRIRRGLLRISVGQVYIRTCTD